MGASVITTPMHEPAGFGPRCAGELTGRSQIQEWGLIESPVFLTSTMQVGRVYDAACRLLIAEEPDIGVDDWVIPIVGECDDSWLNDARRMHVQYDHVAEALAAARRSIGSTEVGLGSIGAGTGMCCYGWKGGIGSASRLLPDGHVLGVLVLANFGSWERLTIAGVPVGRVDSGLEVGVQSGPGQPVSYTHLTLPTT